MDRLVEENKQVNKPQPMRQFRDDSALSTSYTHDSALMKAAIPIVFFLFVTLGSLGLFFWNYQTPHSGKDSDGAVEQIAYKLPILEATKILERSFELTKTTASENTPGQPIVYEFQGFYMPDNGIYFIFRGRMNTDGNGQVFVSSDFLETSLLFTNLRLSSSLDRANARYLSPLEGLVISLFDPIKNRHELGDWTPCDESFNGGTFSTLTEEAVFFERQSMEHAGWTRLGISMRSYLPCIRWEHFTNGREYKLKLGDYREIEGRHISHEVLVENDLGERTKVYLRQIRVLESTESESHDPLALSFY